MRVSKEIKIGVKILMYITENLQSLILYQEKNCKFYFYTFLHILNSAFLVTLYLILFIYFEFTSNSSFYKLFFDMYHVYFFVIISRIFLIADSVPFYLKSRFGLTPPLPISKTWQLALILYIPHSSPNKHSLAKSNSSMCFCFVL